MNKRNEKLLKAREFAKLTGVTVRALHHYDRLSLLKPTHYSEAGYRLYAEPDVVRLEQIIALKFIGLPLREIRRVLKDGSLNLADTLRRQREAIEEKRRQLGLAVKAIQQAESVLAAGAKPNWESFAKIIEVINMQSNVDWTRKYYSEEAQGEIEKRAAAIPAEVIEQAQRDWANLIQEVEAAVSAREDPGSVRAQELAGRWTELIKGFTGGSAEIQKGLNRMYADQENWPASMPRPFSAEVQTFIAEALKCRQR